MACTNSSSTSRNPSGGDEKIDVSQFGCLMPKETDLANETFWDQPCGESHFKSLGFDSLSQFDDWFFDYKYPYLSNIIPFDSFAGKKVLEVGLGYGSVSQKIMESGASFYGLDLAKGPVELVRGRLKKKGFLGEVIQGSVLDCPWDDSSFDGVVSIGCLHHTGDLTKGIQEIHRVLKPGGNCVIMVYNAFSYRQLFLSPVSMFRQYFRQRKEGTIPRRGKEEERVLYDSNLEKESAPATDFVGSFGLKAILRPLFSEIEIVKANIGDELFLRFFPRSWKLKILGPLLGLDLYATLTK